MRIPNGNIEMVVKAVGFVIIPEREHEGFMLSMCRVCVTHLRQRESQPGSRAGSRFPRETPSLMMRLCLYGYTYEARRIGQLSFECV